jgi:hypothetical protein
MQAWDIRQSAGSRGERRPDGHHDVDSHFGGDSGGGCTRRHRLASEETGIALNRMVWESSAGAGSNGAGDA